MIVHFGWLNAYVMFHDVDLKIKVTSRSNYRLLKKYYSFTKILLILAAYIVSASHHLLHFFYNFKIHRDIAIEVDFTFDLSVTFYLEVMVIKLRAEQPQLRNAYLCQISVKKFPVVS